MKENKDEKEVTEKPVTKAKKTGTKQTPVTRTRKKAATEMPVTEAKKEVAEAPVTKSKSKTLQICKYLSDKKAYSIIYIDVESKTSLCDYFVICSGRSSTQVKSLAENLDEKMEKEQGIVPRRKEGIKEGRWAVLDYEDVIVHIFNDEERDFYHLERLWEDGKNLTHYED